MEVKCETCRYGVALDNNGTQCRWGPPALAFNLATGQFHPIWPELQNTEWCHRWKRKLGGPEKIEQPAEKEE